jgi:hypothetical protein
MLSSLQDVNFDDVELSGNTDGFAPVPDGEYQFQVVEAYEEKTNGGYDQLKIQCAIVGPSHANRRVFHKFFTGHPDKDKQKAVIIGTSQLKSLCEINGIKRWPKNDRELIGWKFNAKLSYREWDGKHYEELKYLKKFGPTTGAYGESKDYLAALNAYKNAAVSDGPSTAFNDEDIPF